MSDSMSVRSGGSVRGHETGGDLHTKSTTSSSQPEGNEGALGSAHGEDGFERTDSPSVTSPGSGLGRFFGGLLERLPGGGGNQQEAGLQAEFRDRGVRYSVDVEQNGEGQWQFQTPSGSYDIPDHVLDGQHPSQRQDEMSEYLTNAFERQYINDAYPVSHEGERFEGYPFHNFTLQAREVLADNPYQQPPDGFGSEREALQSFATYADDVSGKIKDANGGEELEIGAELLKTDDGRYEWGRVMVGSRSSVDVEHSIEQDIQDNARVVGSFHTHPESVHNSSYGAEERVSVPDIGSLLSDPVNEDGVRRGWVMHTHSGDVTEFSIDQEGADRLQDLGVYSMQGTVLKLVEEGHVKLERTGVDADPSTDPYPLTGIHRETF